MGLIRRILKEMGKGKAMKSKDELEITTEQAAKLLHVFQPYVVGLVNKDAIPARVVGNQRHLLLKDVPAYKRDNEAKRRDALSELAALYQEVGLR